MSRIRKAYEVRLRTLLQQAHARRLEQGVRWLVDKARCLAEEQRISPADALTAVYQALAVKPYFKKHALSPDRFFCDAGLGGLARWLRAAGYDTLWRADIDDDEVLNQARLNSATLLTTDSLLMERRVLRDRIIPALWLPPTLTIRQQLALVFQEFNLTTREPRCMECGGELMLQDKEALRDRIPPRTYRWLDQYFVCARCGKLFWRGTHWERIDKELRAVAAPNF